MEAQLVLVADAFCAAREATRQKRMRPSTLSMILLNSSKALDRIRAGEATLTVRKWEASMAWLSEHWPPEAEWPPFVFRPAPQRSAAQTTQPIQSAEVPHPC